MTIDSYVKNPSKLGSGREGNANFDINHVEVCSKVAAGSLVKNGGRR